MEPAFDPDDPVIRQTVVAAVERYEEIGSTSDRAAALASRTDLPLPLLITAKRQTAGRGRGARNWHSGAGGLPFTLLLDAAGLQKASDLLPLSSLAVGLAVAEALEQFTGPGAFELKWPNDVLHQGRKIAGILIEGQTTPPRLAIGVGINRAVDFTAAPEEVQARAISLHEIVPPPESDVLLIAVLRRIEAALATLVADRSAVIQACRERDALRGQTLAVEIGGRRIAGIARGIASDGALLLERDGHVEAIRSGSITEQRTS